jgi:hypothetical protein
VAEQLGDDFRVGHSYFMTDDICTEAGRERTWRRAILPLLDEYFHNRQDRRELLDSFSLSAVSERIAAGRPAVGSA